jgi:hypothetical protein
MIRIASRCAAFAAFFNAASTRVCPEIRYRGEKRIFIPDVGKADNAENLQWNRLIWHADTSSLPDISMFTGRYFQGPIGAMNFAKPDAGRDICLAKFQFPGIAQLA